MSALTQSVAIICATVLIALGMFKRTVQKAAEHRKYFVFSLQLPLKIRWTFSSGEDPAQVEHLMRASETDASGRKPLLHRELDEPVPTLREPG